MFPLICLLLKYLNNCISYLKQLSRPATPVDDRGSTPPFLNSSQAQQSGTMDKPYKPKFHTALYSNDSSCSSTGATINSANNTPHKEDQSPVPIGTPPCVSLPLPSISSVLTPAKSIISLTGPSTSTSVTYSGSNHHGLVSLS